MHQPTTPNRRAILFMFLATVSFITMAAFIKMLREGGFSTAQVMFWRTAPGVPLVMFTIWARRLSLKPAESRFIVYRVVFGVVAMGSNFYALQSLSLAQHNVLHLLQPVFIGIAAPFLLNEKLSRDSLAVLAVSVVGVLLVIRPSTQTLLLTGSASIFGLIAALGSAASHMATRRATRNNSAELLVLCFSLSICAVSVVAGMSQGPFFVVPVAAEETTALWQIAGAAGFGLSGQLFMTHAYARGPAPVVAMVAYTSIPLSFGFDVALWGAPVRAVPIAGAILVFTAGAQLARLRSR